MRSSRMRTAPSSSRPGGSPPGTPLGADPPAADPPPQQQTSPGSRHPPWRPAAKHTGIPPAVHAEIAPPPPVNRILDTRL